VFGYVVATGREKLKHDSTVQQLFIYVNKEVNVVTTDWISEMQHDDDDDDDDDDDEWNEEEISKVNEGEEEEEEEEEEEWEAQRENIATNEDQEEWY